MKIILDAMGGDHAPEAPVLGAIAAARDFNAQITLVGRGQDILDVLNKNGISDLPEGVQVAHADEVVDMHDDPTNAVRKKNSSMMLGLKMLSDGEGDAFAPCPRGVPTTPPVPPLGARHPTGRSPCLSHWSVF